MTAVKPQPAVLIVDDDPNLCKSLARILKQDGYRIDVANSAAETLNRESWSEYFAILVDRKLPDSNSDELLRRIKELAQDAAVMVITGHADLKDSLQAIRLGAADYLLKPINPDHLRMRLHGFAELKRTREEIRERDAQIEFMVNNLPAGAAYVDLKTDQVLVNKWVVELTGYSDEELADRDAWFQLLFGEKSSEYRTAYEYDRTKGLVPPRLVNVRTKTGKLLIAEFSGYRYDNHEVWLINDVTERQRYEEQLRQQRDFSDRILETAQVIILVLDEQGRIIRFNKFMEELSGYSLEDVQNQSWFDVFIPDCDQAGIQRLFNRLASGENVAGHVNPIQTKSGQLRQIAWWGKSLRDEENDVINVLSIGHDVTDLQSIQSQLVQSERLAAIGEMIAGLAHESRNALQRARACLDMLALDLTDQPRQMDLTRRIETSLDELQRLYEEVRGYAAPIQLSLGRCQLQDVWETAWQHVTEANQDRSVTLQTELDLAVTECVIDRLRIEQVIRNIFENAFAAAPPEGVMTLRAFETEIDGEPAIAIQIADDGTGIHMENPDHVFEPFFTTKQKGTGLGLAISKRIIEAHHGTIRVAATSAEGATIEIVLPRHQSNGY